MKAPEIWLLQLLTNAFIFGDFLHFIQNLKNMIFIPTKDFCEKRILIGHIWNFFLSSDFYNHGGQNVIGFFFLNFHICSIAKFG
jgi:hypothetical protein